MRGPGRFWARTNASLIGFDVNIFSLRSLLVPDVMQLTGTYGVEMDLWIDQMSGTLWFRWSDREPIEIAGKEDFIAAVEYHRRLNTKIEFEKWRRCTRGHSAQQYRAHKDVKGRFRRRMVTA